MLTAVYNTYDGKYRIQYYIIELLKWLILPQDLSKEHYAIFRERALFKNQYTIVRSLLPYKNIRKYRPRSTGTFANTMKKIVLSAIQPEDPFETAMVEANKRLFPLNLPTIETSVIGGDGISISSKIENAFRGRPFLPEEFFLPIYRLVFS